MLFDPTWEATTKPAVFSLDGLVAWLETMPADKRYNYEDCSGECLYGQYMTVHGIPWKESGHFHFDDAPETLPAKFCDLVYAKVACFMPHTFGAALERAGSVMQRRQFHQLEPNDRRDANRCDQRQERHGEE